MIFLRSFSLHFLHEPVIDQIDLGNQNMSKEVFIEIGSQLGRLRMYPVFDVCHYLLTALLVRDDIQQHQAG